MNALDQGDAITITDVERLKYEASRVFMGELVAADHDTDVLGAAAEKFNKRIAEINRRYAAVIG